MDQRPRHPERPAIRVSLPRLHVVTDDDVVARAGWESVAESILESGGSDVALHVRAPHANGRSVFESCERLLPVARDAGGTLVVNDRVDVACALRLDAHLGRRSLSVADARTVLGETSRIGVSCHTADEVASAAADGAEYAFFGNVLDTPSHTVRPGTGLDTLGRVAAGAVGFPVIAIGGIGVEDTADAIQAGAYGVAVLRGIWDASNSRAAALEYISALGNVEEK